ncbi:MAG: hypothetical protein EOM30_01470 [Clostridia bacterium]|nr:hypothetical protein [Clostridia bacterium]
MSRPQDKHLIPLTERSEEEAHAIRSAGGKAVQEKKKQQRLMSELLSIYSDLPITDKRKANRLKKLGIEEADLSQKALIADAIMKGAQNGNSYLIQMYLDIVGESGMSGPAKENNLLDAIRDSTKEDIDTDDLPELQQEAELDADVVE